MDHLIVCNKKQKATKTQQMKSSHKKLPRAAICFFTRVGALF